MSFKLLGKENTQTLKVSLNFLFDIFTLSLCINEKTSSTLRSPSPLLSAKRNTSFNHLNRCQWKCTQLIRLVITTTTVYFMTCRSLIKHFFGARAHSRRMNYFFLRWPFCLKTFHKKNITIFRPEPSVLLLSRQRQLNGSQKNRPESVDCFTKDNKNHKRSPKTTNILWHLN